MSAISHQSIDKDFLKAYLCVKPANESEEWPYAFGQWHPILIAETRVVQDLTDKEVLLLQDLSSFYQTPHSFPLRSLTEDLHTLKACDLFSHFPPEEIGISLFFILF